MNNQRGATLLELILAVVLMTSGVLLMPHLFSMAENLVTTSDARNALKQSTVGSVNTIGSHLISSRRLFQRSDTRFWDMVVFSTAPAPNMATSKLPVIGTQSPLSPSATGFVSADVGNILFFATFDNPRDINAGGQTIRLDVLSFHIYYVVEYPAERILEQPKRVLWEWKSENQYVSWDQLAELGPVQQGQVIIQLRNPPVTTPPTRPILVAWDIDNAQPRFYDLTDTPTPTIFAPGAYQIEEGPTKALTLTRAGIRGYRTGISPNWTDNDSPYNVPRFAIADPNGFPGGFEVVVGGPSAARQVLIRLVLAAEGAFKSQVRNERVSVTTVRDY